MALVVYPKLSNRDLGFIRIGGAGLANCMYVAARAYLLSRQLNCEMLRPTWERMGIGQFLRHEKDKRFYAGLFNDESVYRKLRKLWKINALQQIPESEVARARDGMVVVEGLGNYFEDLLSDVEGVRLYFRSCVLPEAIAQVPDSLSQSVAVHVRLGDFPESCRIPISWYYGVLEQILQRVQRPLDILLFSDGTDEELKPLLEIPGVRRVFYGNALADIVAISRCGLMVGSHSTFSGWGAYLGQVPCIFSQLAYGRVLVDESRFCLLGSSTEVPEIFWKRIGW